MNHDPGVQAAARRGHAVSDGCRHRACRRTGRQPRGACPMSCRSPLRFRSAARLHAKRPRARSRTAIVEFYEVTKIYPTPKGPLTVVESFNLLMNKGEFISLIGHSGCGKSTVLSMAAGLNDISGGGIVLDGKEVDGRRPGSRPWSSSRPVAVPMADRARERDARRRPGVSACEPAPSATTSSNTTCRASAWPTRWTSRRPNCPTA